MSEEKDICKVIADYMLDEGSAKIEYEKFRDRLLREAQERKVDPDAYDLATKAVDSMSKDEQSHERFLLAIHKILKCPI